MPEISFFQRRIKIRQDANLVKLRVVVDERVEDFVRRMEYKHKVSKSAVVETALLLFMLNSDESAGDILRSANATMRRR